MTRSDRGSVRFARVELIGAVGFALLSAAALQSARDRRGPAQPPARGPVSSPPRTPFAAALHEAVACQWRAQTRVNEEREALEAWDPGNMPEGGQERWRLQLMAQDRTGGLRQARAAVRRAAALARTPDEAYEAALLRARIECNAGDHEAELQQARRLLELQPQNRVSWMLLRRAAECAGRTALEQKALAWLRAAGSGAPAPLPGSGTP